MIQLNRIVVLFSASALGVQMHGNQPVTFGNQPNPNQHLVPQVPDFIEGVHGIVMNFTGHERCYVKNRISYTDASEPSIISEVPEVEGEVPMHKCTRDSHQTLASREAILNRAAVGDGVFVYQWEKEATWRKGTYHDDAALAIDHGLFPSNFWPAVSGETQDLHIYWGAGINDPYVIGIPSHQAVKSDKKHILQKIQTHKPKEAPKPKVTRKPSSITKAMSRLSLGNNKIQKKTK